MKSDTAFATTPMVDPPETVDACRFNAAYESVSPANISMRLSAADGLNKGFEE